MTTTQDLPEPKWAGGGGTNFSSQQALYAAVTTMHNALLQEMRLQTVEQRRTNQLLEWLGGLVAQQATPSD